MKHYKALSTQIMPHAVAKKRISGKKYTNQQTSFRIFAKQVLIKSGASAGIFVAKAAHE